MNEIVAQKKCNFCGEVKSLDRFSKDPRRKTGVSALCLDCNKNKSKAWREKNPDKARESTRNYRNSDPQRHRRMCDDWSSRNPERVKELARKNYKNHAEAYRESSKKRHERQKLENPQYVREYQSNWRKENPDKVKQTQRKWSRAHPERIAVKDHNRNEKKRNGSGSVTEGEWIGILEKYNYTCLWCKRSDVKMSMDHVVPLSLGGLHEIENIQPLCKVCNSRKGARTMDFR